MLKSNLRWIQYHDLTLDPTPGDAPLIAMDELIEPLRKFYQAGNAKYYLNNDTAVCRIVDFCYDTERGVLILLLQLADKNISEQAYVDLETGKIRTETKKDGEGVGYSAHVMITLDKSAGRDSYIFLLERVPGLYKSRIERFMTKLFSHIHEKKFLDARDQEKSYRPLARLAAYPSKSLLEALETGELKEITLIERKVIDGAMDDAPYAEEKTLRTTIKVVPQRTFQARREAVSAWIRIGKSRNAEKLRVKFRAPNANNDSSAEVDLDDENVDIGYFTRQEKVEFQEKMSTCESTIHNGIIERMFELLEEIKP